MSRSIVLVTVDVFFSLGGKFWMSCSFGCCVMFVLFFSDEGKSCMSFGVFSVMTESFGCHLTYFSVPTESRMTYFQ